MSEEIYVGVGASEQEWLPFQVLKHSILSRTSRNVVVEPLYAAAAFIKVPMPRDPKQRPVTAFSFQRFLLPEICSFVGKSIYLDSDQIVRGDIGELWDTPFPFGAKCLNTGGWQSAVMLIDNAATQWRIAEFVDRLDSGEWSYGAMMNLKYPQFGLQPGLDPLWNVIDRPDPQKMDTKRANLLHYTDMGLQPWLNCSHPHGALWSTELLNAIAAGAITVDDVLREINAGHVRPSLALLIGEEPVYADHEFIPPHKRAKT